MAGHRGPAPTPLALRLLHGEHRPSHVNYNEPKPRPVLPEPPPDMAGDVRQIWADTIAELEAMNIAHAADRDALACYCEAVATHRRASMLLAKSAILVKGQKGNLVRNPVLQIQRDAAQAIRGFAQEFGLTPSARTRIEVKGIDDGKEENPFAGTG